MRVLVVKLGAIGDVIMSLTMVSALRAAHPGAHLTWVVGKTARQILTLVDGIDEVITVDDVRLLKGGTPARASEILRLWRRLLGRTFDLVLTGHSDARYRLLTLPVFARARRGFGMSERAGPLPGRRHSNEYSRLVLGTDGPDVPLYQLPRVTRPLPAAPYDRSSDNGMVVVMAPGGARNVLRVSPLRRWPTESYVSLARALIARGYTIVLVGGEQDTDVRPYFTGLPVVDLLGRTSLPELASAFAHADAVVTHDSLAVHMARLVRARIVALFGPTSPLSFGPENIGEAGDAERTRVIWGGARLPCRPCYDGREFYTCPSNRCMTEISVNEVLQAVYEIAGSR
jgi:heptosyltransferase-2